jgi:pyridoxine/pyridoxamine 5'-phosphate oxidase
MGNYKELGGREAIAQLQVIVKHQSICMMVTATEERPPHSRPMAVADERGVFWFLTLSTSEKFEELTRDPRISLYFAYSSRNVRAPWVVERRNTRPCASQSSRWWRPSVAVRQRPSAQATDPPVSHRCSRVLPGLSSKHDTSTVPRE